MIYTGPMRKIKKVSDLKPAPQWLKDQMEALRKLPPPTLEEVRQSFAASEKWRKEHLND